MEALREWFTSSPRIFIITVTLLVIASRYLLSRPKHKLPPGPFSLPIVGTLPFLGVDLREPLKKLSETYGDIFTVYFGSKPVIILNSYDAIKEAFVKNHHSFTGRPQDEFFVNLQNGKGMVCNEGPSWREQRKVSHAILRDFGIGSSYMEERIQTEAFHFIKILKANANKSIVPADFITPAVSNVIYSVVFEHRQDYDNPRFVNYLNILSRSFELLSNSGVLAVFPSLRYLPGDMTGYKEIMKMVTYMQGEYARIVKEHVDTYQQGVTRDFVDGYLKAMYKEQELNNDTYLCTDQLERLVADLFAAGTETTTNTLRWGLMYMMHYPDAQKKVQEEIDRVLGKDTPSMSHKQHMPYTEACIHEIQRLGDIVPLGVPHSTMEDVTIQGYTLPKGIMVISHLYSVHYNERLWPNPRMFEPNRFLDEEGKFQRNEKLIPFSMGKRVCLGESLARMELFLFFVSIFQHFTVKLPKGDALPELVGTLGITNMPKAYRVHLIPR